MSIFSRLALGCVLASLSPMASAGIEPFDEGGPFDWSLTRFPRIIANGHTLARPRIAADTTCVPVTGGYPVEILNEREGQMTGGSSSDCEAWAFRPAERRHRRSNTRMTANIDHTELAGTPQKAGLVARGQLEWAGPGQGWVFSSAPGDKGYAAVVTYLPATPSGYPTTVTIYKLVGDCLSAAIIMRQSPTFFTTCVDQHFLTFDVFEASGSTILLARLEVYSATDATVRTPIAIADGPCEPYASDDFTLCATDASAARPRSGHNGLVGYAVGPQSVFFDDVDLSDLTSVSFDDRQLGPFGSSTGAMPGSLWFNVPADLDGDLAVDLADLAALLVDRYQRPNGTLAFGNVHVQPADPNFGQGLVCRNDLIDLALHLNRPASRITMDYIHSGGPANLSVNDGPLFVGPLSNAPSQIAAGITLSVSESPIGNLFKGRLTLEARNSFGNNPDNVCALVAGGASITIDNIRMATYSNEFDCVADVDDGTGTGNPDGGVTIDDLLFFLFMFEAGDIRSDVDDGSNAGIPDGGVTIDDLLFYLFRFEQGC